MTPERAQRHAVDMRAQRRVGDQQQRRHDMCVGHARAAPADRIEPQRVGLAGRVGLKHRVGRGQIEPAGERFAPAADQQQVRACVFALGLDAECRGAGRRERWLRGGDVVDPGDPEGGAIYRRPARASTRNNRFAASSSNHRVSPSICVGQRVAISRTCRSA